ncbi:LysR family transcriptional regulator [uncultured Ferrovibrio sp.]|jgi:Transcriptional regulator|uniref:LysR family transcriptional regulator n=1 Tax=uncultured Ferrovibrio sp. TaxID=1576913 RepID=UPI002634F63E|nr:LysR family transcriptional regulator [uncultured Ferrovibrio sp.]
MDRLQAMQIFAAVAETESFAAAARRLGLSPPVVTRAVAGLEERIGTRLLHRTTRSVRLTDGGQRFLKDCRRILADIDEAEAAAAGQHAALRGRIAITAPVMFGRLHVAPAVMGFLDQNPQVSARLLLLDRVVDMMEEGIDVAVRIAHLTDSALIAVKVGELRRVTCASTTYLKKHGEPKTPADLQNHPAIFTSPGADMHDWAFDKLAKSVRIAPPHQLVLNSSDVAIAAVLEGRGFTRLLSYQVAAEVRAGRIRIVLQDFEPPPVPVHLVQMEGRRAPARVRAFIEYAAERLRADLAQIQTL